MAFKQLIINKKIALKIIDKAQTSKRDSLNRRVSVAPMMAWIGVFNPPFLSIAYRAKLIKALYNRLF